MDLGPQSGTPPKSPPPPTCGHFARGAIPALPARNGTQPSCQKKTRKKAETDPHRYRLSGGSGVIGAWLA